MLVVMYIPNAYREDDIETSEVKLQTSQYEDYNPGIFSDRLLLRDGAFIEEGGSST